MSQQKKKKANDTTKNRLIVGQVMFVLYSYCYQIYSYEGAIFSPPGLLHPRKSPVQTSRVKTVTVSCKRLVNKKLFLPCMRLPYNSRECFVTSCSLLRLRAYNSLQNQTPFLSLGFRPPDEKNELVFFRMGA